jgi:hypothetical protein
VICSAQLENIFSAQAEFYRFCGLAGIVPWLLTSHQSAAKADGENN